MRYLRVFLVCYLLGVVGAGIHASDQEKPKPKKPTETCFYKAEEVDGQNRICYYDCLSGKAAITIKSVSLCPLSIKR